MSLIDRIARPEYLFRPRAAVKRLRLGIATREASVESLEVLLPWSRTLTVFPDIIGRNIEVSGVFDIAVTEAIYRLVDAGELVVDVGANVGYLTSLLATRVGPDGAVVAIEPHPDVFRILELNVRRWADEPEVGRVDAHQLALSNQDGTALLSPGGDATSHMGLGSLQASGGQAGPEDIEVPCRRLDDLVRGRDDGPPSLIKIDVEGHERMVLEGAAEIVGGRAVRDIVFEDHGTYPTPTMRLLEQQGMKVLTLDHTLFGPRVYPVHENAPPRPIWPGPNYLGTFDPQRALERLQPRGWLSLGLGRRRGGSAGIGRG